MSTATILVRNSDTADPFGTEQIRARVLDAWRATPARFREDANTEEDFALGGYRDRLFVELLQNASDSAVVAGVDGKVLITLDAEQLVVANTGHSLTVDGVQSLASMRASAKRADGVTVGRFGVGFAAVLSMTDEPRVLSTSGGVCFSAARTAVEVRDEESLQPELAHREGHVPVLRLPFADDVPPLDGYDVAVVLPFRNPAARAAALELIDSIDEALLIALPGITQVVIDVDGQPSRTLVVDRSGESVVTRNAGQEIHWRLGSAAGSLPAELSVDRPTEERQRNGWTVTWAVPVDDAGNPRGLPSHWEAVVRTPTPTSDRLDFPALLIASFPVDSARHHVEMSRVTEFVVARSGETYAQLVCDLAERAGASVLDLVPRPALVGGIDTALRTAVVTSLASCPLARLVDGDRAVVAAEAVVLQPGTPGLVSVLSDVVDGLVAYEWGRSGTLVDVLGARPMALADVLEELVSLQREPSWWRELYDALEGVDTAILDGLPVPLVDGRVVRGVRSCLLPEGDVSAVTELGLRVVHPDAVHRLLSRLGARPGDAGSVLRADEMNAMLREAMEPEEQQRVTRAVLALVAESGMNVGDVAALAALRLPTNDGRWLPAGDLLLPGTDLASAAIADANYVDSSFVHDVGRSCLVAVGALESFRVVTHHDVLLDADSLAELLDDGELWGERVAAIGDVPDVGGAIAAEVSLVRGLEVIRDDAWESVWPLLAEPDIRRALVEPVAVVLGDGRRVVASSMSGWWLSDVAMFGGLTPRQSCTGDDPRLRGLFAPVPAWASTDPALLKAIGVASSVEQLMSRSADVEELLVRLAEPDVTPSVEGLLGIYRALAELPEESWPDPPERLRVVTGDDTELVSAEDVTVVTAPHHVALVSSPFIEAPESLADVLDLRSSTELVRDVVVDGGTKRPVPAVARVAVGEAPQTYREHDDLVVGGTSVQWWVDDAGEVHASTMDGLARGLAWTTGQWTRRWELATLLAEPDRGDEALIERAFD